MGIFFFSFGLKAIKMENKTKVLSVQLGKTLSFVKFVVEWGGVEGGNRGVKLWIVVH